MSNNLKVRLVKGKGPGTKFPPVPQDSTTDAIKNAADPDHYKGLKKLGIESINVLEAFMEMDSKMTPTQKMLCVFAMKYLLRAGRKDSVDIDLQKAENYIHRARKGEWLPRELMG